MGRKATHLDCKSEARSWEEYNLFASNTLFFVERCKIKNNYAMRTIKHKRANDYGKEPGK
jgi:hypothetical protein